MSGAGAEVAVGGAAVGELVGSRTVRGWIVDPVSEREGPGEIRIGDGVIRGLDWLDSPGGADIRADGVLIAPGFVDLHTHLREPGNEDAETVASGLAAAAHGGFTTVCAMPNTTPPADDPAVVGRVQAAADASGSPVRLVAYGCVSAARAGEALAPLGELADAGVVGFSDDGAPVRSAALFRNALLYAGSLGLPLVEHAEDPALTAGAEMHDGYVATVLGLRGWPVAGEVAAVARAVALLEDVVRDEPRARLHLTHVSTAAALAIVRDAKARGLPLTCDVAPHHLALSDEWVAGSRRWAWEAVDERGRARDPWADGALTASPYDPATRVNPPLRSPEDAIACLAALADGTADAVATDHAPHTVVDKDVEYGLAANGISGLETALGCLLAAVDAGRLTLARAVEALTVGPARVLGARVPVPGIRVGDPADLVVVDRGTAWRVEPDALRSKGMNTPLLRRELRGVVRLTVAAGRIAYTA
ncbi:MAG TPA: dihydroorotase [Candidatus Limnocylindrales bacterium]|nr:dihydroorotase [Candidatus Limnocylindrales bacterium]